MNAKVMKDFVEQKPQGLTAEHVSVRNSSSSVTLTFSNQPIFVSIALISGDDIYTVNVPYSSRSSIDAWYALNGSKTNYVGIQFSGNQMTVYSSVPDYIEAVAFF